jgi:hypothetical protein
MNFTETAVIRLRANQLDRQFELGHLEGTIAVLVLGVIYSLEIPNNLLIVCALPLIISVVRWILGFSYNRKPVPSSSITLWKNVFNVGSICHRLSWGLLLALVILNRDLPATAVAAGAAVIVTLCTIIVCAGALPLTIAFTVMAIVPGATIATLRLDLTGTIICARLFVPIIGAILFAKVLKQLLWDSTVAQNENEQLTRRLDQHRTQVEKLNVTPKTTNDKRDQAEITLRRSAADLRLTEGKANAIAATMARTSPICELTALSNRRHLNEQLNAEWRPAIREKNLYLYSLSRLTTLKNIRTPSAAERPASCSKKPRQ